MCDSVGHAFNLEPAPLAVLSGIDLSVSPGETLAIIGPSGSGKSTLLNIIMGRIKPLVGQIEVSSADGETRRLGVVFQQPALLPWLDAAENVLLPLELEGRVDGAEAKVRDALTRTGLIEFASYRPRQLSGGMQSRVAFARAIVNHPDLLLLDEPFSDIDEATTEEMMIDVARLIADLGVTAVLVTHSLRQAAFLADQVVVLSARPGCISAHHILPRERPRTRAFLDEPAFASVVEQLRMSLRKSLYAPAT